ncbi:MAG: (Na+)-NQR maturation NqrM [Planctomycetales bacterium]|nr:(Na+)-NQR maturation NqrM [Planctomycetales bacterium]
MSLLFVFGLTLSVFLLVIVGMGVGVLMGRRAISGSCGGLANSGKALGTPCSLCSKPAAECTQREAGHSSSDAGEWTQPESSEACDKDCLAEGCSKEAIDACKGS